MPPAATPSIGGRLAAAAGAAVVALAVAGCDTVPDLEPTASASETPEARDASPTAAAEPHESDLPPGFDSPPDSSATPDAALSAAERTALLRVPATAAPRPETCQPDAAEVELWGYDVAAGSRYSSIRVTNASDAACTVAGYPGIGARGEWGSAFLILAEQDAIDSGDDSPVSLAPGATASAPIRWTGALAGAHDEWISLLVVQLAQGQEPIGVRPVVSAAAMTDADGAAPHDAAMDVGMLTDVRVGSFSAD